ncbi:MAG: alpha/beta fold hydrolase [Marinobacter sp.]|uniref:alpha/beta fold hydrolase n=1 Tax=Marinobacter sp. TaxID=50741 RepID=UPI00299E5D34|nr:alpha/beta fold hydrolase [Marinobacter sp.]MDX1756413.1 alpha/beta fold hydrolase [Marinobacter sp.]
MSHQDTFLIARDSHRIPVYTWRPDRPQAVLVISHGMAEHGARYAPLAQWLRDQGILVVVLDHRGHGPHCPPDDRGHYADRDGWQKVIDDLHQVIRYAQALAPELPLTLFGHSMGSFIAQACAQQHGEDLDSLILCATNRLNRKELKASRLLIGTLRKLRGARRHSKLIGDMTFGAFNKKFEPTRTSHDWLSRDPEQVDRYLADPYCGFECTIGLWYDFVTGMLTIDPQQWRRDLPVHLIAGSADPVGEMGRGVSLHCEALHNAGIAVATFRLYNSARHELINEVNAQEVWQHLLGCLPLANLQDQPETPSVVG